TLLIAKSTQTGPDVRPDAPRFDAPPLRELLVAPPPPRTTVASVGAALRAGAVTWREEAGGSYPYVLWVNDGLDLLRAHTDQHARVFVMDMANPFSLALQLRPPRGDALFWNYKLTFDADHFPSADRVFREVTHVMVPKTPLQYSETITMQRIYR